MQGAKHDRNGHILGDKQTLDALPVAEDNEDSHSRTVDPHALLTRGGVAMGSPRTIVCVVRHVARLLMVLVLSACTISPITAQQVVPSAQPDSLSLTDTAPGAAGVNEILIPAGPFQMGCSPDDDACEDSARPLRAVTLDAYYIDVSEVTNARYVACADAGVCTPPHALSSRTRTSYYGNPAFNDFPVVNVDWFQAAAFCAWEGKRLPSEAEWEKAARGSADTRIYPWGNQPPDCTRLNAWDADKAEPCIGDTTAVGSYPTGASPWGVLDMGGNVWEWVGDWYLSDAYSVLPAANPLGPATGFSRVFRGGSWYDMRSYVSVSYRIGDYPERWADWSGFRCVRRQ